MQLVRTFAPEQYAGLRAWTWLPGLVDLTPLATSPFGDVFLKGAEGVWYLDTLEGRLTREWDDVAELNRALDTGEGQDRFLLGPLAEAAFRNGVVPEAHEILFWTVLPVLGGAVAVENIGVVDVVVGLDLAGQIHRQVQDLPAGTQIRGLTVDDDGTVGIEHG